MNIKTFSSVLAVSLASAGAVHAAENPFATQDLEGGYMVAAEEKAADKPTGEQPADAAKPAEGEAAAEGDKAAEGGAGAAGGEMGVDMAGNEVQLPPNFTYGGDNMGKYAGGKIGTGEKDPAVCGTFADATCSIEYVKGDSAPKTEN